MTKILDYDLAKEPLELQEFAENVRSIINNGNVEFEFTNASEPGYTAPDQTKIVFSVFGAQYRLYISYLGDWYYTTMTKA